MTNQQNIPHATTTFAQLERVEQRMQRRWFDLAMAEQRGQPMHALERMYDAYLRALDDYVALQRRVSAHGRTARLAS
jgi:hypothetical protein